MSLQVFPTLPGLTFTVVKMPEFDTDVQAAKNAYEVRLAQTVNPVWHFTMVYDFLRDFAAGSFTTITELKTLMGFFLQMQGKAGSFLFTDPDDNSVGPAIVAGSPNTPLAKLPLITDGTNYYSPIQRTLDGVFYEDITDLNGAITVYANGVLQALNTNYTVAGPGLALPTASYMGMYLNWGTSAPATPITAQFNFYFRVRFESDSQDFEKFMAGWWTIGGSGSQRGGGTLRLQTARPNSA